MLLDRDLIKLLVCVIVFLFIINISGEYYVGSYLNNKYDGRGKLYRSDGSIKYEGEFVLGHIIGFGTSYRSDGSIYYKGNFVLGMKHGYGTLYNNKNKVIYEGRFSHDRKLKLKK